MNKNTISQNTIRFVRSCIMIVTTFSLLTLLCALLGVFYAPTIWVAFAVVCVVLYKTKIITFPRITRNMRTTLYSAATCALLVAFFTTPTIFSGRDQGAISEAAINLANNHHLITHTREADTFFAVYGAGKALHFPGFFYTDDGGLLTQFPLPYITFLAAFYGVFSIAGLVIANALLLTVFLFVTVAVARVYVSEKYAALFMVFLVTSFAITWFAKYTLSENIAGVLLWSSVFLYLCLVQSPTRKTFVAFIFSITLLLFARIEGMWFFCFFCFLALSNATIKTFITKHPWWHAVFPATLIFCVGSLVAIMNIPFFTSIAHVLLDTKDTGSALATSAAHNSAYLFSVYALYGLLVPLVCTVIFCALVIRHKKYRFLLLPVAVVLPLWAYYLFPHISSDHPWMLRRFVFALLPATFLVSTFLVAYLAQRFPRRAWVQYIIVACILCTNIPAWITFLPYAQHTTLHRQIHDIARQFSPRDLVLIDKDTTGDGWAMMTGVLRTQYNVHAVYFFNVADYAQIDKTAYNHIYLITPNTKRDFYRDAFADRLSYHGKCTIATNRLEKIHGKIIPRNFPHKQQYVIRNTIYELAK